MDFGRTVRAAAAAAAAAAATEARGSGAAAMRAAAAAAAVAVRESMMGVAANAADVSGHALGTGQCGAYDAHAGGRAVNATGRSASAGGIEEREAKAEDAGGSAMGAGQCAANDVRAGGHAENAVGRAVIAVGAEGRETNTEAVGRRAVGAGQCVANEGHAGGRAANATGRAVHTVDAEGSKDTEGHGVAPGAAAATGHVTCPQGTDLRICTPFQRFLEVRRQCGGSHSQGAGSSAAAQVGRGLTCRAGGSSRSRFLDEGPHPEQGKILRCGSLWGQLCLSVLSRHLCP
eukprot:SAG11_NODE_1391_length_5051_cov_4.319063_6_plen_289_part_00